MKQEATNLKDEVDGVLKTSSLSEEMPQVQDSIFGSRNRLYSCHLELHDERFHSSFEIQCLVEFGKARFEFKVAATTIVAANLIKDNSIPFNSENSLLI